MDEVERLTKAEREFRQQLAADPEYVTWRESLDLPRAFDLENAVKSSGASTIVRLIHSLLEGARGQGIRAIRFDLRSMRVTGMRGRNWVDLGTIPKKERMHAVWHLKEWSRVPIGSIADRWECDAYFELEYGVVGYRVHFLPEGDLCVFLQDDRTPRVSAPLSESAKKRVLEVLKKLDEGERALDEGRTKAAEAAHQRAADLAAKLDDGALPLAWALEALANGSTSTARKLAVATRLRDTAVKSFGQKSPITGRAHALLGSVHVERNQLAEAVVCFKAVVESFEKAFGPDAIELVQPYCWLAHCMREQRDVVAAERWSAKADRIDAIYFERRG